ncbi:VWA domain-containing protein [Pseudanabaena sp. FACHB-2040]|uniref:VWA domain-containing protein n=1 Tax=Pseudanabaena sp. FACHB-2040 TaxID=2692859 RepID=UPI001682A814|nr:VWA domain-containing protein [Pseudanabaena sp. FACHB-2040]MBD2256749.1 VWA domain-containing protein [Pseudanabaena sp. FACHB-2040]
MSNANGRIRALSAGLVLLLVGCNNGLSSSENRQGLEVKLLVGSALGHFCDQAAEQFNQQDPKLSSGEAFYLSCEAAGSGDVVNQVVTLAQQLKSGTLAAEAPEFPTLISVDGEIYHSQLIYQMEQVFPGQNYIPPIADAPLLANSPMVFMTQENLAPGLQQVDDLYRALTTAQTHQDLDAASPAQNIYYVHTAPTRSNSGLQTLVAQYASVSGKRPEDLTPEDIQSYQSGIQSIQSKITRYGVSTGSLAQSMLENGPFWASIGSVYESSVIEANSQRQPDQPKYVAVYPKATFTSNMRGILPNAPWVSAEEKEAAEAILAYLQTPAVQQIAAELGLRPGVPGVPLGAKFSPEFGVNPQASYDSYRPPQPQVVEAILTSWEETAKKPSLVVIVVDSSGSMEGNKMPAVQSTLQSYITSLGPKDKVALIDFDSSIRSPVLADSTPEGQQRGLQFINSLQVEGGTRLYDASLYARNWLRQNRRDDAINAVLVLTDGEDSESGISLEQLGQELQQSGFSSDERIAFFTVGYGEEGDFDPEALQQIAQLNGGYYSKGDPATIARLMSDLQLEF